MTSKTSRPIEPLDSDASKFLTHLHSPLLLSLYAFQFGSIVTDPVPALLNTLIATSVIQVAYAVLCLPPTEGGSATAKKVVKKGFTKAKNEGGSSSLVNGVVPAVLSLTASLAISTPVLTITLILMGAPLTTHLPHTVLCAAHMSLLASLPLFYTHGVDSGSWRAIVSLQKCVDEVFAGSLGALLGAWVGAIPVPLDWDREWQKWPITIVTGAYIGYSIGVLAGRYVFKGKTIDFN